MIEFQLKIYDNSIEKSFKTKIECKTIVVNIPKKKKKSNLFYFFKENKSIFLLFLYKFC